MLHAEGLTVTVRATGRILLDGVSCSLRSGEVVALLGPNGAGKSTLLRCLSGAQVPEAGAVHLAGRPLAAWDACERARRLAVLPQQPALAFAFTALQVVLLGRTPHCGARRPSGRDRAIASAALAAVNGEPFRERLFPTLSGGEQQRVQLARVLCQLWECAPDAPRALLLDEPLAGLDLRHQHAALRVARGFAARGGAVLVSLHDLNQAAQHADRVLVLQNGRLVADGTPRAVLAPPLVARVFGTRTVALEHPVLGCPVLLPMPDDDPTAPAMHGPLAPDAAPRSAPAQASSPRAGSSTLSSTHAT